MKASELHELVKDCPEAWPEGVKFGYTHWSKSSPEQWYTPVRNVAHDISDAHAVLMFIASGMLWLSKLGSVALDDMPEEAGVCVTAYATGEPIHFEGNTPVAAIFAAIKAVKGKA